MHKAIFRKVFKALKNNKIITSKLLILDWMLRTKEHRVDNIELVCNRIVVKVKEWMTLKIIILNIFLTIFIYLEDELTYMAGDCLSYPTICVLKFAK